jgi:hypothetical protein
MENMSTEGAISEHQELNGYLPVLHASSYLPLVW